MGVPLCGARAGVAEQFPDQEQTGAVGHRKTGEAMAQIMDPNALEASPPTCLGEGAAHTDYVTLTPDCREYELSSLGRATLGEDFERRRGQGDASLTVLPPGLRTLGRQHQ